MSASVELTPEVVALFDAVVAHPFGVQLLYKGNLESVAVLFGAHPTVVDRVRGWMASPGTRVVVAEGLLRARHKKADGFVPDVAAPAKVPAPALDAEGLIRAALEVPGGDEFLCGAPAETVAIVFGVHPFVVSEAREILCKRGQVPASVARPRDLD